MDDKRRTRDPTAHAKHPWYFIYQRHKHNPLAPWVNFVHFCDWAEKHHYAPENGDRVTLRVSRYGGFRPRIKRRGKEDPIVSEDRRPEQGEYHELAAVWNDMHAKCSNEHHHLYRYVGGQEICVAPEWATFEPFRAWALEQKFQCGQTLMRYDRNADFAPANCCFA